MYRYTYRGFTITKTGDEWWVEEWGTEVKLGPFISLALAYDGVDLCKKQRLMQPKS